MTSKVSIHAPHEGERPLLRVLQGYGWRFNPRSPRGGATGRDAEQVTACGVSIHAPHEGERRQGRAGRQAHGVVSIHAPHEGERHRGGLTAP